MPNRTNITTSINHPEVGVCGLSCRLCPGYHTTAKSRCPGCKSNQRMSAGCPFITCAIKNKRIEFCFHCKESDNCQKWADHRNFGKHYDTFKCYQTLDDDISFIQTYGLTKWLKTQLLREQILTDMLENFNAGRSKSLYCIAATVLPIPDLKQAIALATSSCHTDNIKHRAKTLGQILTDIGSKTGYHLKLRKK